MAYRYQEDDYPNELRRLLESLGPGESLDPRELANIMGGPGTTRMDSGDQASRAMERAGRFDPPGSASMGSGPGMDASVRMDAPVTLANLPTQELADRYRPPRGGFIRREDTGETLFVNGQPDGIGTSPEDANRASLDAMRQQAMERFGQNNQQRIKIAGYGNGIMSDVGETMGAAPVPDFARGPVDTPKGRGFYGKDGAVYVKTPEGFTKVILGYDRDASYVANKRDLERRSGEQELVNKRAELDRTQASTEHQREVTEGLRAQRDMREDPNSQAVLEKKFGKPEKGMRWKADGTPEPVPGNQKEESAKEVLGLLDMAEPILNDKKTTGSGVGSLYDKAAGVFGSATDGAKNTAKLKSIAGLLVSKMPRMEGPQSNFDVKQYQEMAGELGDDSLPLERRMAALKTIREINERYSSPNGMKETPANKPVGGAERSRAIFEAKDALRKGADPGRVRARLEERGIKDHGL